MRVFNHSIKCRMVDPKRARRRLKALAIGYRQGRVGPEKLRSSAASFVGYMKYCDGAVTTEGMLAEARQAVRS